LKKSFLVILFGLSCAALLFTAAAWAVTLFCGRGEPLPNVGNRKEVLDAIVKQSDSKLPLRFAVMGDVQQGVSEFKEMLGHLQTADRPDFIVMTGDIVCHADNGHYRFFLGEFEGTNSGMPVFVAAGNHDVRPDAGLFEKYFGPRVFYFEFKKCLFMVLDNSLGSLDEVQHGAIEQILTDRRASVDKVFMFMHRPPVPSAGGGAGNEEGVSEATAARLLKVIEKHRVDYVFSGHAREFKRVRIGRTTFVVNGLGGSRHSSTEALTGTPAFCVTIEASGGDLNEEIKTVGGTVSVTTEFKHCAMGHLCPAMKDKPVWAGAIALGVVLCALLTGKQIFRGKSAKPSGGDKKSAGKK
jgi:Icc-related predicted phosphoesterase